LRREVNGMEMVKKELMAFLKEEDGVGVIEIVLILVVLIGLVIIFKKQITTLLNNVFKEINSQSKEVY
jgi:Flp pilus assembly pilin Flp